MGKSSKFSQYCYLCNNKRLREGKKNDDTISFHRFPSDPTRKKMWLDFCNLNPTDNVKGLRLCSNHFQNKDFYPNTQHRLRTIAVPSIRKIKVHGNSVRNKSRVSHELSFEDLPSHADISDIEDMTEESVRGALRNYTLQRNKIQRLLQMKRKFNQRIKQFNDILIYLGDQNVINQDIVTQLQSHLL